MVLGDSFGQSVFKESLARLFRKVTSDDGQPVPIPPPEHGGGAALLEMGFGATLEASGRMGWCVGVGGRGDTLFVRTRATIEVRPFFFSEVPEFGSLRLVPEN